MKSRRPSGRKAAISSRLVVHPANTKLKRDKLSNPCSIRNCCSPICFCGRQKQRGPSGRRWGRAGLSRACARHHQGCSSGAHSRQDGSRASCELARSHLRFTPPCWAGAGGAQRKRARVEPCPRPVLRTWGPARPPLGRPSPGGACVCQLGSRIWRKLARSHPRLIPLHGTLGTERRGSRFPESRDPVPRSSHRSRPQWEGHPG